MGVLVLPKAFLTPYSSLVYAVGWDTAFMGVLFSPRHLLYLAPCSLHGFFGGLVSPYLLRKASVCSFCLGYHHFCRMVVSYRHFLNLFELALVLPFCFAAYSFAFSLPSHYLQRRIIFKLACPRVVFLGGVLLLDLLAIILPISAAYCF